MIRPQFSGRCQLQKYAMYGPCGVKRKFSEVEGMEGVGTYIEQRQSILDISMYKLRMPPVRRTEPSLHRSVLIYNTLRIIEHELQQEGVAPMPVPPNLFPAMQKDDVSEMTLDPLPGVADLLVPLTNPLLRPDCPPLPTPMDTTHLTTSGIADDVGDVPRTPFCPPLTCPSEVPPPPTPPPALHHHHHHHHHHHPHPHHHHHHNTHHHPHHHLHHHHEEQPQHQPAEQTVDDEEPETEPEPIIHTLQPVSNATKLLAAAAAAASPTPTTTTDVLLNSDRPPFSTSVLFDLDSRAGLPALPTGCSVTHLAAASQRLGGAHHHGQHGQVDIFGDIDLTLYDFDLLSSFSSNVMKMAPLSAEELMHSFPADSPPPLSSPSPCYRNELLNDDLDHIMQVLVGI